MFAQNRFCNRASNSINTLFCHPCKDGVAEMLESNLNMAAASGLLSSCNRDVYSVLSVRC